MALRRRRSWASMKARWGSQAEAEAAANAVSGDASADAGGRGGGICCAGPAATPGEPMATPGEFRSGGGEPLLVPADRLAIDPRDALDLSLACAGLQQGPDGCL
jgi:hypothetical protein